MMAGGFGIVLVVFVALVVLLDRWRAAVKSTDEYEGNCWACGQTSGHKWGCPNR
jgi:hypothetical protein